MNNAVRVKEIINGKTVTQLILVFILVLLVSEKTYADIFRTKTGITVEGEIISETDTTLKLKTGYGMEITLEKSQIESIEEKESDEEIYFKKVKEIKDDDEKGHYELGIWSKGKNLKEYAKKQFQKAIEINREYRDAHFEMANLLIEENDIYGAVEHIEEIDKIVPEDTEAKKLLQWICKKWPKMEYYIKAKKIAEDDAEEHYQLGIFCFEKGWFSEGRDEWKKTVGVSPEYNSKVNEQLAQRINDIEKEIARIENKIERKSTSAASLGLGAMLNRPSGTYVGGIPADEYHRLIDRIRELQNEKDTIEKDLATMGDEMKQEETGLNKEDYLIRVLKLKNGGAEEHYQLGVFCVSKELFPEARKEFEAAIKLDYKYKAKIDTTAEEVYQKSILYQKEKEIDKSLKEFQKIIEAYPDYPYLGDVYKEIAMGLSNECGELDAYNWEKLFVKTNPLIEDIEKAYENSINLENKTIKCFETAIESYRLANAKTHNNDIESQINFCRKVIDLCNQRIESKRKIIRTVGDYRLTPSEVEYRKWAEELNRNQ